MPQFDFNEALPQILWLAFVFGLLFLIVKATLPKVDRVVTNRRERIAADLRTAEAARDEASAATSGGSTAVVQARARALDVTGRARDEAAVASRKRLAELDQKLAAEAEQAAAELAAARSAALAELDRVAIEATVDLVKRVSGVDISNDEAAMAINRVAA